MSLIIRLLIYSIFATIVYLIAITISDSFTSGWYGGILVGSVLTGIGIALEIGKTQT